MGGWKRKIVPKPARGGRPAAGRGARSPSSSPKRPLVIVMARAAVMGRVKTRLARQIGQVEALRFYRSTRSTLLRRLAGDARFKVCVAIDPPSAVGDPTFPRAMVVLPQMRGDLGRKMQTLLDVGGVRPTIVIGTDIPGISRAIVANAVRKLQRADAIIGRAEDGGFWLFGVRGLRRPRAPFSAVRWSQANTAEAVVANIANAHLAEATVLSDVDSADDLTRLRPHIGRVVAPS